MCHSHNHSIISSSAECGCAICASAEICEDDYDWGGPLGDCSTYAPGQANTDYCDQDDALAVWCARSIFHHSLQPPCFLVLSTLFWPVPSKYNCVILIATVSEKPQICKLQPGELRDVRHLPGPNLLGGRIGFHFPVRG